MTYRFPAITLTAFMLSAGAALAQMPPAPPLEKGPPDKAEMQRHFAEMCQDRLAHATGDIAFLEAKLSLTDAQKPLFERWKKIRLNAAKAADCTPPAEGKPSLVDGLKHEEKTLRQRLDELKAELPALEALAASLSDDQKAAFDRQHHTPHWGGDHQGPDGHGPDKHGPNEHGSNEAPPPPEH
jgi:hypothetical protein